VRETDQRRGRSGDPRGRIVAPRIERRGQRLGRQTQGLVGDRRLRVRGADRVAEPWRGPSLIKENGDNAIGLAKDCMSNIRQFAHLDGFLYLLNDSVKKDVINFTQDRVYKLKNEDIKNQFLIVRKYFDLQDFIDENYHPSTMSSLDVRPYPNGHRINKRASLDTYDAKGKVFPNRK
jgi:hypothetical protein